MSFTSECSARSGNGRAAPGNQEKTSAWIGIKSVRTPRNCRRLGWFLLLTASERFLIEFARTSDPVLGPLTLVQAMALPLVTGGAAILFWRAESSRLRGLRREIDTDT